MMALNDVPLHLHPPGEIELNASRVDKKRTGCFALKPITKGEEFGPYSGRLVYDKNDASVDPKFSWEVFDLSTFKYLHTVDATNPDDGNWMRFVCCARYFEEQNIVSTQNGTDVYYRALKDIKAGEELLTWFQPKKKKRKRNSARQSTESLDGFYPPVLSQDDTQDGIDSQSVQGVDGSKRKRKPKIIPDAYIGPLDWEEKEAKKLAKEEEFEPLQPGQKRRRRKKLSVDTIDSSMTSRTDSPSARTEASEWTENSNLSNSLEELKPDLIKLEGYGEEKITAEEIEDMVPKQQRGRKKSKDGRKKAAVKEEKNDGTQNSMSISEINESVDWEFPEPGEEYIFRLRKHHIVSEKGKRMFKCDICLGLYKHMFSLKRHYLRNHINYKYVSKADMANCLINLVQVKQQMAKYESTDKSVVKNELIEHPADEDSERTVDGKTSIEANISLKDSCVGGTTDGTSDLLGELDSSNCSEDKSSEKVNDQDENTVEQKFSSGRKLQNGDCIEADDGNRSDSKDDYENTSEEGGPGMDEIEDSGSGYQKEHNFNDADSLNCEGKEPNSLTSSDDVIEQESESEEKLKEKSVSAAELDSKVKKKTASKPGLFKCYSCYITFDDLKGIHEHTVNHPEEKDSGSFPCDQCSMRFNYKHNLLRHKNNHLKEEVKVPAKKSSFLKPKKPLLLPNVFRCGVCPQKFDSQPAIMKHVSEDHNTGSQFQCVYCGKEFLSQPNMKKHVRFHLGYRATCRFCSEAFSNVGALRKHTRIVHPEEYKARLIERLEKYGALKGPDKNALSAEITSKVTGKKVVKASKDLTDTNKSVEKVTEDKSEEKTSTDKQETDVVKEDEFDNDINFTADEIDDGGSRFKFACTVCKKRFSSYINMCRHRRKVHTNESRFRTDQCLTFERKPRNNPSPVLENPVEVAAFYANVSHNIATNLNCYIDGKQEVLKTFADHITVEDYKGNFGYSGDSENRPEVLWKKYNFPCKYRPAKTVSFADIKKEHNIHDDFDSHCVAVDTRSEESACRKSESENSDQISYKPEKLVVCKEDCASKESVSEQANTQNTASEDTAEDVEVQEINKVKNQNTVVSDQKAEAMGKSAQGRKMLASLGSALTKKGNGTVQAEGKVKGDKQYIKLKISDGVIISAESPATRTFHQVKLGEYTNFQDDLDYELSSHPEKESTSSFKPYRGKQQQSADRRSPNTMTRDLEKAARDEIAALYDNIDSTELVQPEQKKSPPSLSRLCEHVLGLSQSAKQHRRKSLAKSVKNSSGYHSELASRLRLAISVPPRSENTKSEFGGPYYSDASEESPFYNYDTIAFGRHGAVEQVCAVCRRHFTDFDVLLRHHIKKHPASVCSFLEVEKGHEIDYLHFPSPSCVGAVAVTDPGLDDVTEMETYRCTNCNSCFRSIAKLHVHIINCSSIDPLYGIQKMEKTPVKTPLKKKLQKKFMGLFGNPQDAKLSIFQTKPQLDQRNSTPSQKRVFTGCRKRTSVILPDSPVKASADQKSLQPTATGYNPQNHVRRRELTEILDTLTCEACGLKFNTIIVLERHVKYCTKKEKFKTIQPMACPLRDESLQKIKNACLYCGKNFTYTKSLLNHFQDFCPVKRGKIDDGSITEEDQAKEKEICERIKKADEEKTLLKQQEIENRPKRKITWQVGRKPKRKGHAWTAIKKRYQNRSVSEEESLENDDTNVESSPVEYEDDADGTLKDAERREISCVQQKELNNSEGYCESPELDTDSGEMVVHTAGMPKETLTDSIADEENGDEIQKDIHSDSGILSSEYEHVLKESGETVTENSTSENTDESFDQHVDVNNTSLNCTARYQVNQIAKVPKSHNFWNKTKDIKQKYTVIQGATNSLSTKLETNNLASTEEAEFLLAQRGLITGKRKRERVGKVEDFLKNAFRKKRKKREDIASMSGRQMSEEDVNDKLPISTSNSSDLNTCSNQSHHEVQKSSNLLGMQDKVTEDLQRTTPALESSAHESDLGINSSGFVSFELPVGLSASSNQTVLDVHTPRKRGRPRVRPLTSPKDKVEARSENILRKRGRPPKRICSGRGRPRMFENREEPQRSSRPVGRPCKVQPGQIDDESLPGASDSSGSSDIECQSVKTRNLEEMEISDAIDTSANTQNLGIENRLKGNEEKRHVIDRTAGMKQELECKEYMNESETVPACSRENETVSQHEKDMNQDLEGKKYMNKSDTGENETANRHDGVLLNSMPTIDPVSEKVEDSLLNDLKTVQTHAHVPVADLSTNFNKVNNANSEIRQTSSTVIGGTGSNLENFSKLQYDEVDGEINVSSEKVANESTSTMNTDNETVPIFSGQEVGQHMVTLSVNSVESANSEISGVQEVKTISDIVGINRSSGADKKSVTNNKESVEIWTDLMTVENAKDVCENNSVGEAASSENTSERVKNDEKVTKSSKENHTSKTTEMKDIIEAAGSANEEKLEPVLSPGERVKLNKRGCKKEIDLTSPVWVKRTQQSVKVDVIKKGKKKL